MHDNLVLGGQHITASCNKKNDTGNDGNEKIVLIITVLDRRLDYQRLLESSQVCSGGTTHSSSKL